MVQLSERKKYAASIISKNINGRELVVWGQTNTEFEQYLFDMYGLKVAFTVYWDSKFIDGFKCRSMSCLANNKDKYYLINYELQSTEKNASYLITHGYEEFKDYYFFGSNVSVVPKEMVGYSDANGNTCSYCPSKCKIIFRGHNSKVVIDESVSVKGEVTITLRDECSVVIEKNCILGAGSILCSGDCASFEMKHHSSYNSPGVVLCSNSKMEIGAKTTIRSMQVTNCQYNLIQIGDDCMLSQDVILMSGDGHAVYDCNSKERTNYPLNSKKDKYFIRLGRHTWVGIRAVILGGTDIGEGSIVSAGSVVKGKFPNNCIVAGNPARNCKQNVAWGRDYMNIELVNDDNIVCQLTKEDN